MRRSPRDKPRLITDALLRDWPLPPPGSEGSKEARGRILIIGGAVEMPGAVILASNAALRAGAGKVRVATARAVAPFVATEVPELFAFGIEDRAAVLDSAAHTDAVLIGSGMRDTDAIRELLPQLLKIETLRALIIDASALSEIDPSQLHERTIITPHRGEMCAMLHITEDELANDPINCGCGFAFRSGGVVVLKGAETLICSGDHSVFVNNRGNVGLATAGSGDVLAGIIAGFCARGAEPLQAAVWGVAVHARAGERLAKRVGSIGYLAREIVDEIPRLTTDLG
ncbi:MAG: NAD(P)H-hydrate dehydratase [Chthoniobacterales bacterium]